MVNRFKTINPILDYDQVQTILGNLCKKGLKKQKPIIYTISNISIDHFIYGKGSDHIILTGATHGCEIITTDFLLHLIDEIISNKEYDDLKENYTLHFVPIVNPEGYIISTSAIRTKIKRETSLEETAKIAKNYYLAYKQDDINAKEKPDEVMPKEHQKMFETANYESIPDKYDLLKRYFTKTYTSHELPKGCMVTWNSNVRGIDPNCNIYNHPRLTKVNLDKIEYDKLRYNNILITLPGPIKFPNYIGPYVEEPENRAMDKLINEIKYQNNLCGILIYHSTWGKVFYEPYSGAEIYPKKRKLIKGIKKYNKKLGKIYAKIADYDLTNNPGPYYFDEELRLKVPGTLLIELSKMGGNPIGPYGDLENYDRVINDNIKAAIATIRAYKDLIKEYDDSKNEI